MATGGVPGNGCKVAYSVSSPVSWVTMTQVLDITLPTFVTDEIDITTHSTTNKLKKTMGGLAEVGDMTLVLLADLNETTTPAHSAMFTYNQAGTSLWWRVEIPTNRERTVFKAYEFQGNVGSYEPSAPINDRQEIQVLVRFDGDTFTQYPAGSSSIS
jgi:hypothetical protein